MFTVCTSMPNFSQVRKTMEERRSVLEKARSARVKRIRQDVNRIAKREIEFSKNLVSDLVPFRVVWNEEALKKIKEYAPFTIEEKDDAFTSSQPTPATSATASPEVVDY